MQFRQNLKKEGLELLVESYLTRRGPDDLLFMQKHVQSTEELLAGVSSDMETGLPSDKLIENAALYGRNHRLTMEDNKWQKLGQLLRQELIRPRTFLLLFVLLLEFVCGIKWKSNEVTNSTVILVLMVFSWGITVCTRWRAALIMGSGGRGREGTRVFATRGGEKCELNQEDILVGDVLFVDCNQPMPASGIIASTQEVQVDESFYGRGLQRKMSLEQCLKEIEPKNQLELKIDNEQNMLASPVLLRGSRFASGGAIKMVVLAVEQAALIEKYKLIDSHLTPKKSTIEEWTAKIESQLRNGATFGYVVIIFFHVLSLIFKILGLPPKAYPQLLTVIIECGHIFLVFSLLLDTALLFDLLQGEYLNALNLVGVGQELDRFLSVEQIFITEESICKYDKFAMSKIVLVDLNQPVDIKLLPALQPTRTYSVVHEIIGGVGLDDALPQQIPNKSHRNVIVHINNSQEKVFSSFYEIQPQPQPSVLFDQGDSVGELLKSQIKGHESQKLNRISPDPSASVISDLKLQQSIGMRISQKQETMRVDLPRSQVQVKLDDYLSKHCHFSTQNIIEGLQKLAKNQSRTYYYQKYSLERLSRVKYVWIKGKFVSVQVQHQERLLLGIKRLERQNLTVYLIGMDEGAFNNKYMGYLVGAVGVEVAYQQEIVEKLQKLEEIGIHSLFTIYKRDGEDIPQEQVQQLEVDFVRRRWKTERQHFCKMPQVKQMGGRMMCGLCLTSMCGCKGKNVQLANIQNFLQVMDEVKCVYNLNSEDIQYLQLGFEQLNMTTLKIIQHGEDTYRKLNQIIAGHHLVAALEEDVTLWMITAVLAVFFFFPFNYVSFGHVFTYSQMYFTYLYLQVLFSYHHFTGQPELSMRKSQHSTSRRRKQMLGWAVVGDITVFLLLISAGCIFIVFFPEILIEKQDRSFLKDYKCQIPSTFYHNNYMLRQICTKDTDTIILYSELETLMYVFTIFCITFRAFLSLQNPFKLFSVIFHVCLLGLFILMLYICPEMLHFSIRGLQIIDLGVAAGMAFCVVILTKLTRLILSLIEQGKSFHFELNISLPGRYNDYSQILKEYKQGKTLQYAFEE